MEPRTKILVTGKEGQLGKELQLLALQYPSLELIFTDRNLIDITCREDIANFLDQHKVQYLINCAAYTNVDNAQQDPLAKSVNTIAPGLLGQEASKRNVRVIHISTDYVFSGKSSTPYTEKDEPHPLSEYGISKLEGERELQKSCPNSIILRTSWLYSPFGKNFVKTMLHLGEQKNSIKVVEDQIGSPTYAYDLATAILEIICQCEYGTLDFVSGIYHYTNQGVCSWYDFAQEIQHMAHTNCKIIAIGSKDYPTVAPRPHYSVLNKSKIKHIFEVEIPYWKKSLKHCIKRLQNRDIETNNI